MKERHQMSDNQPSIQGTLGERWEPPHAAPFRMSTTPTKSHRVVGDRMGNEE